MVSEQCSTRVLYWYGDDDDYDDDDDTPRANGSFSWSPLVFAPFFKNTRNGPVSFHYTALILRHFCVHAECIVVVTSRFLARMRVSKNIMMVFSLPAKFRMQNAQMKFCEVVKLEESPIREDMGHERRGDRQMWVLVNFCETWKTEQVTPKTKMWAFLCECECGNHLPNSR